MSICVRREHLRQRAEYTQKLNANSGRHGWIRLTPAYSLRLVEEIITGCSGFRRILDPFCGTGTTALSAAYHGHVCVTTDINPFLVWLAQVKSARYSTKQIEETRAACREVLHLVDSRAVEPVPAPPLFHIERWWSLETCEFLCYLRAAIEHVTQPNTSVRHLLLVAFCRTLMEESNAAFHHQSLSFRREQNTGRLLLFNAGDVFANQVQFVLSGAADNPTGEAFVSLADARHLAECVTGPFDLVITSPPYANRMSYIRELRPYMYWLGFLSNGREAGELDWAAIGGTWGIATSRLTDWERPEQHFKSTYLESVLQTIASSRQKSGALLARYVARYVEDMWKHFCELPKLLASGAEIHYIVGNSTFYGTLVSTEQLYVEMLSELGFSRIECRPIRKRNSNKHLFEFDVVAYWK